MTAKIEKFFDSLTIKNQIILVLSLLLLMLAIVERPNNLVLLINIGILLFLYFLLFQFVKYIYKKVKNS